MSYTTYEFSAFTEADLLAAGAEGRGVSCGDTFTMPGGATTCFEVSDNDSTLSGDNWCNENANDKYGQTAAITGENGQELGNGGQIYAEKYFWVCDDAGNWYVMIEIEQEGSNDDYFTFYTGHGYTVPEEGVELTVYSSCNVRGSWIDFNCLDAGEKGPELGSISGTVFCDLDCDGVQDIETTVTKGDNIFTDGVDFEGVNCTTYNVDGYGPWYSVGADVIDLVVGGAQGHNGNAHDNTIVELDKGGVWCRQFNVDESGTYCLQLDVYRNSCVGDQGNTFLIKINGETVQEVTVTEDGKIEVSLDLVAGGNRIDFVSLSDVNGYGAGIDNIELLPLVETTTIVEPGKEGVVVVLLDADGNEVLDGNGDRIETVTDADGNYQFDGVPVGDYRVKFENPDGTEFTFQNVGDDDTIDSDVDGNGVSDVITVVADQTTTDVDAGLKPAAEPGSLSGRYFFDGDRDGLDNDGANNGIEGILVELLDENGDPTGVTTMTDDQGNYSFGGLDAGTYGVKFTDPDTGRELTTQNANGNANDDIDSDAADIGGGMSQITGIAVVSGQDTPDNDAGVVEIPGSLSGRYFCDENGDGFDNDNDLGGPGEGIAGIRVDLLDAAGQLTGQFTTTGADGSYSFTGLVPGVYGVRFESGVPDKVLTIQNADGDISDDIDSDAMADDMGFAVITNIVVTAGQDTSDNDIGVTPANADPEAEDVAAAVCADDMASINLLDAVSDPDGDMVQIVSISDDDETAGVGESITLDGGGVATLNMDGTVSFDPNGAYDDLLIRESVMDQFQFTASDGNGGMDTATATLKVCGALNTIETIAEGFVDDNGDPLQASYQVDVVFEGLGVSFPTTVTADAPVDPRLEAILGADGVEVFDDNFAYCVDKNGLLEFGVAVDSNLHIVGSDAMNTANDAIVDAVDLHQNLDIVTWILNQDFQNLDAGTLDDGDLGTPGTAGRNYNFNEVQDAIWFFTDGDPVDPNTQFGANSQEIIDLATTAGEGYVAGEGDKVAVLFDPVDDDRQTYVVAVDFEDLKEDCECVLI